MRVNFGINQLVQGSVNYSLQVQSSLPPVFVNKVSLEHSQAHLFTLLSSAAFPLQQQSRVAAVEIIWPTEPKILSTWALYRKGLLTLN